MSDASARILIVDDDRAILDALGLLLEDEGYAVRMTEQPDDAENLHGENGVLPDLIVLDVMLSGKDGRTICRGLKSRPDTRHIPIVLVSAYPDAGRSAREAGGDAFLPKPFSIDDLLTTVETLLAARRAG